MDTWKKAGENLVKHRGGGFYLRTKVAGKIIRCSPETSDLRVAKRKRDLKLEELRKAASREEQPSDIHTLGDALELVAAKITGQHGLKAKSAE
jgi:hypothetical protein